MKKEASGKKGKWLWLVLALVALLAVVGVVLALLLGGGDGKKVGGRPDLYWNVDREANVDRDTGLSIREAAEDGNYYVRFAHDGEQVEIPVADKKLVNYIDSLDLMSLQLDDDGYVVDILPVEDVASILGESLYVQSVSGDTVIANSSIMMNGRKITVKLNEDVGVYNVSGKGEFVGEALDASTLNPMDTISIYGTLVEEDSEEESIPTHVYVLNKPAESKIYFRADQFYDSTNKVTTREPDENGAYTIKWYCEGEIVDLKCKNKDMVTTIDSADRHWCHWGLEFDEDGYIIDILDSFLASRTLMQCERYDITEISEDGSYTATSLIKNNGAYVQGVVGADCPIYDISSTAKSEGQDNRRVDSLQLGDRVCIWTDTMGNPVHIYITRRAVDSVGYRVITRSYSSATGQTTRTPNANGYYEIEMLKAGDTKNTMYYTKDIEIASAVDRPSDQCVGLKVGEGNIIEYVYDIEAVFGHTYFVRGYYILDATGSVATFLSPAGSGYTKNGVVASDAKVWNVSTLGQYGAETTLQYGDTVYAGKTPIGEIAYAYVTRRAMKNGENSFYWRIDSRQYDTTNKVTTREPDAEGYYVYLFAHEGQQVTLKTKNKEFATALDYQSSAPAFALEVKGDIITAVHDGTYAYGGSRYNGWTIDAVNGDEIDVTSSTGSKDTWNISEAKIFNVSNSFTSHKGERIYSVKVGDVVANYRDINCTPKVIIVKTRETNKMAWPVAPDLNRQRAEDGWFYIDLAVDGKIQTFKCKSEAVIRAADEYTGPFGIQVSGSELLYISTTTYVENVKGSGVTTVTVESVSGSSAKIVHTLGAADKVGTKETLPLASNVKIYDVTAEAASEGKFGSVTKLQKGDVIRSYKDDDGNHLYIYVIARHTKDYYAYCSHCEKPVYWTPYIPSSNATSYDTHYYLATDLPNMSSQIRVYNTSRDYEIVLDLNGHTAHRNGGRAALVRYGDTLTIIDSVGGGKITTKNNTSGGGVIMISGSAADGIGVVNLYGGTLTVEKSDDPSLYTNAGGIITNSGGEFNMYGGKVINGVSVGKDDSGAVGGNIRISSGTFNMYDGEISGGMAMGAPLMQKVDDAGNPVFDENGQPVLAEPAFRATGNGGNIYAYGKSTVVNIYGGTISGGMASRGGNCSFADGTFYIHGGTITGGIADANLLGKSTDGRGGNIFSTGNLYIKGGKIENGVITSGYDAGGNIMSTGFNKTVYVSGGEITNGLAESGNNIYLMYSNLVVSGGEITCGQITEGQNIATNATNTGGYSSVSISGGKIDGNINLGGSVAKLEVDENGQHYYISSDVRTDVYFKEDGSAYTLTASGKEKAFYPDYRTALTLTGGSVEKITANKIYKETINVSGNPVVGMLTIGSNLLKVDAMASGADVTVDAIGVFTKPGLANASAYTGYFHSTSEGFLASVTSDGALKFSHPDAVVGHCDHCDSDVDWMPWSGGSLGNGHYFLQGDVQLQDGEVTVKADAVLDLKGYTVTAAENSRCFYVDADFVVMDSSEAETGLITGGRAVRGGNIYVSTGSFTLLSGTIANGVADNDLGTSGTNGRGGNIFSFVDVSILGGKVVNGSTNKGSNYGGNIMITGLDAELVIGEDAVIADGTASTGSNIALMYSNMTLNGGQILNGDIYANATSSGGYSTVTVNDGVVDGTITLGGGVTTDDVKYPDYRTVLIVNGGEIKKVNASKAYADKVTVSGKPAIGELVLGSGILLEMTDMVEGADINVNATGVITAPFASKAEAEAAAACIAATAAGVEVVVTDAFEVEIRVIPTATVQKYCEHCDQTVEFKGWSGVPFAEGGHYFLEDDLTLSDVITVPAGMDICLDLNGKTLIAAANSKVFTVSGQLSVIDTSADMTGVITGGCAYRGGNIYVQTAGSFTLYSGTISGGVSDTDMESGTTGGRGGNIFSAGGNVTLKGGVVSGGSAVNGSNWGGNIFMTGGTLTVEEDAVISGGNATTGGNVYLMYAAMVMTGGEIKDGVATNCGGVYLRGSGGNYSSLTMSGGIINGKVFNYEAESTVSVSGTAQIMDLSLKGLLGVGELADGASILVNATSGVFTDVLTNADAVVGYFDAVDANYKVAVSNNKLEVVADSTVTPDPGPDPVPGANCEHCTENVTWTPWTYTSGTVTTAGHYILEDNIEVTEKVILRADIVIDLNGHTITSNAGTQIFQVDPAGVLSVMDSSDAKNGAITGGDAKNTDSTSTYRTRGGNIIVAGGGTMNLYSGNITNGIAKSRGGNIYVTGSSTLNIYGGTVSGGVADSHANNIYSNGSTINIYGGTITDTAENGVYNIAGCGYTSGSDYSAYLNIYGGVITGGKGFKADKSSTGNNVTEVTISGGSISGETYVAAQSFEISGKPVIEKLVLAEGTVINKIGTMEPNASILVDATSGAFTDVLTNADAVVGYFDAVDSGYNVAVLDNKLVIVEDTTGGNTPVGPTAPTNCEHCDEPVEWIAWDASVLNADNELSAGHYYLTDNVTIEDANIAVLADNDVVIDLMGFSISAPAATRAFYVYGTLSIQDSSAEQTGAVIGGTVTGGNGGTIQMATNATLNLYSGTIKGGKAQRGGNIYIGASGTTFNMYGGAVVGGVADQSLTTGTSTTNGRGGNIFGNGGSLNLYGGTISDGETLLNSEGKGSSWAGNILMNGGVLTIEKGVVIENGTAKSGANLYIVSGTLNMKGGEINGGNAADGKTVCITGTASAGASTLNISGGTFNGGHVTLEGSVQAEPYVDYRTVVNITGGVLDCQFSANKAYGDAVNVSGATEISSIKLGEGVVLNPGTFAEGAKILVNAEPGAVLTAPFTDVTAAEAVLPYIDTVDVAQKVEISDNKLVIVEACACGCKATNVEWVDANAYMADLAEAGTVKITENVHLKLSADLNITEIYGSGKQIQIGGSGVGVNVSIDLNGFTWSTNDNRTIYVNSGCKLTLIDSSEAQTGKLTCVGDPGFATGGVLLVYGDCDIRGGTLTMVNPGTTTTNGGVLYLNTTGTVNMYGGKLIGGLATSSNTREANGANVNVYSGTFNMYGGMIANGTAVGNSTKLGYGGNLYARNHSSVVVNLYGGLITGGTADEGADIYDAGNKVTVGPDMVVCSSVAEYFEKYITVVDDAGYVLESMTFKLGADFSVADYFENATQIHIGNDETPVEVTIDLNGYTWTGNHRLYVHAGSTLNIKDSSEAKTGVIQSTGFGTNSGRIMTSYGTVNIYGGNFKMVETQDVKPTGAGLIYISKGVLNIYGGVIDGGKVAATASKDAFGGNIYVYSGILNMYGGTIKNGTATASAEKTAFGGNICIRSLRTGVTSELNLYGGTIEGGEAAEGSSIYVDTGVTYTKTDATIENEDTSVVVAPAAS